MSLPLVLASRSPQRRAILTQLGLPFRIVEPDYDEPPLALDPVALVERRSREKARSVALEPADGAVLAVDTEVVLEDAVAGKPRDARHAAELLRRLAGREHRVVSGLTLRSAGAERTGHAVTSVRFRPLEPDEIEVYVASGEWRERAGGYAIQGRGAALVEAVAGDYFNVVGLPVALLVRMLRAQAGATAPG